jgi:hypothetical protein
MIQKRLVRFRSHDDFENLPFSERVRDCAEFVYLFHIYSLITGANFLIWTRGLDGTCERYTFATGQLFLKIDYQKFRADDPSLSRIQRAEETVKAALAALHSDPFEDMLREASPLIDESKVVSSDEFEHVLGLCAKFDTGNQFMLGRSCAQRVISRSRHGNSDAATWIGNDMSAAAENAVEELLGFGGFQQLPHREFEAATGKFIEE